MASVVAYKDWLDASKIKLAPKDTIGIIFIANGKQVELLSPFKGEISCSEQSKYKKLSVKFFQKAYANVKESLILFLLVECIKPSC